MGRHGRYAGLGFIALTIIFLVLAVADQFIVFEIDSIVSFLAAILLLFKDPRARVQVRVLDAIMGSSDEAIIELSTFSDAGFTYLPTGEGVEGSSSYPPATRKVALRIGNAPDALSKVYAPWTRACEDIRTRDGPDPDHHGRVARLAAGGMQENFGLADSMDIASTDDDGEDDPSRGVDDLCLRGGSVTSAIEGLDRMHHGEFPRRPRERSD